MIPTQLRRLPRSAVAAGLDVDDGDKRVRRARSVLVLAELPIFQRVRMRERGALLTDVANVAAAVAMLAERDFDAAIIDMNAPGGGTALVKCIKAGVGSTDPLMKDFHETMAAIGAAPSPGTNLIEAETLDAEIAEALDVPLGDVPKLRQLAAVQTAVSDVERLARTRHRLTPFFLVMQGEQQYAIVVDPPEHSYLEDGKGLSLPDAVMCLDVGKLLLRGPAMA